MNEQCQSPPTILPAQKRIIAIGDLHGDWTALITCLQIANLIDKQLNWCAQPSSTIVIQLGDQIDRKGRGCLHETDEASELKIFDYLDKLHSQAKKVGGGVYSLLGNHEIMNVMGDMRFTTPLSRRDFGDSIEDRIDAFKPGGYMAKRMACTRNIIMKVGSFLFVHGGYLPEHGKISLEEINKIMKEYLLGDIYLSQQKYFNDLYLKNSSLLWTRRLSGERPQCKQLNKVFEKLNLNGLVVGHTPQENGISTSCQETLWKIDTGMSGAFCHQNPNYQVLEILDDGQKNSLNNFKPIRILSPK